jgi:extracellular elastinolytic metalloproteinase
MKMSMIVLFAVFLIFCNVDVISQNISEKVIDQLSALVEKQVLAPTDIEWEITSDHISQISGIHHIYYRQIVNGLPVYGTDSGMHYFANGEFLTTNNHFVKNVYDKLLTANWGLSAKQAITTAANQLQYTITETLSELNNSGREFLFSDGGISKNPIPAELMYFLTTSGQLILVWDITILETDEQNWWNLRVDANTGRIVDKNNYTVFCASEKTQRAKLSELNFNSNLFDIANFDEYSENIKPGCTECYEVFALPIENPFYGSRSIEIQPANTVASPYGWHDTDGIPGAEFTTTRGNNVDAYEDGDNPGYHPDGGSSLNFTGYPFSEIYTVSNQYEDASITNLFYMSNIVHDIAYVYGFDEASGNFQVNNYGNGGIADDHLTAQGQDGAGSCGANMSTPPDGIGPIMQMTICGDKDGDYENFILVHEYTHGVSNRLTGGAGNTGCLNNQEQMGEGWSDFYGIALTIEPGDEGTDARDVGTYLFGTGIREYPYSTDFTVNPQTYDFIKTATVPHGVGSVWTSMIWEMTWTFIDTYGFDLDVYNFTGDVTQDGGNVMALALVTEAFKLQPCGPGFVDGRDAILAADQAIYGGANECLIWEAFSRRGLGFSANQGSSNSVTDGTEAFDLPAVCNLGTNDNKLDPDLIIYPNPSTGQVTIINRGAYEIQAVEIIDVNGRSVQSLNPANNSTAITFSVESLASGIYFIKVETEKNSIIRRIVKE